MPQLKSYQKANKPRHIVNGHAFKKGIEATDYITKNGYTLERIEKILSITIYHIQTTK